MRTFLMITALLMTAGWGRERLYAKWTAYPVWVHTEALGARDPGKLVDYVHHVSVSVKAGGKAPQHYDGRLPFGLVAGESPKSLVDKLVRPEAYSIDQSGNGYVRYSCGPGTVVPIDAQFWNHELSMVTFYEDTRKPTKEPQGK